MDGPYHNSDRLPSINCSGCGMNLELVRLGEHVCPQPSFEASPKIERASTAPEVPRYSSSPNDLQYQPSRRPQLSIIDPSASGKTYPPYAGELTPASSVQGSISSSASVQSGRRSPWQAPRKPFSLDTRRPPSPELTNLDCAFPPFPTLATRSAPPSRNGRNSKRKDERKNTKDSRHNTMGSTRSSKQSTGYGHLSSNASSAMQRHYSRSTSVGHDSFSHPSTTAESNRPSLSSGIGSRKPSLDDFSQDPVLRSSLTESPVSLESGEIRADSSSTKEWHQSYKSDTSESRSSATPHSIHLSMVQGKGLRSEDAKDGAIPEPVVRSTRQEPAYRSRRPAPLQENSSSWNNVIEGSTKKSPATMTPPPPSAGLFSRGFTKLFGTKRSASTASRREIVRQALSDEPLEDEVEIKHHEDNIFEQPRTPPRAPDTASNLTSQALSSKESLNDPINRIESSDVVENDINPPKIVIESEPVSQDEVLDDYMESIHQPSTLSIILETSSEKGPKHLSIESTSSYGSIGFTERSTSSRSSVPSPDDPNRQPFENDYHELVQNPGTELSPPRQRPMPVMPIDPLEAGRDTENDFSIRRKNGQSMIETADSEDESPTAQTTEEVGLQSPTSEISQKRPLSRNKGMCRGCSKVILSTEKSVSSADGRLTGRFHKHCFLCHTCRSPFATAEFYVHSDQPYCAHHYHELENSLCATCGSGIEGLYIETANVAGRGKEKHHPQCLKCATCLMQLDTDYFELSGKVYCERDAFRVASLPRGYDTAPTRPSPLVREYISSGEPGLLKGTNFPERRITRLMTMA